MRYCRILLILGVGCTAYCLGYLAYLFPWPAFLVGAAVLAAHLKRHGTRLFAHGTAAWATPSDMERAGMLGGSGLCLGRIITGRPAFWRSLRELFVWVLPHGPACERFVMSMRKLQPQQNPKEVRLNRAVHTAVFAPTGVGKGVSLVIPFLLECPDSCVVIDPKGENARLTADARRKLGHKVVVIDPFKVVTDAPDTLNPLAMVDENSPLALDDCRAIAKELVVRTGMEPDQHWNDSAESLITTLLAAALAMPGKDRSLQSVRLLLSNAELRQKIIARMQESEDWGGMVARIASQTANLKDKELAGVLSTANRHTAFLDTIPVAASTQGGGGFAPAELKTGKVTVYLILPPEYLRSQSALMRLWIGTMLRACVKSGLGDTKVHFVLDEAASLGRLEVLDDAVDKYRGYGVRLQFYYQSIGQLKRCWGNDGGDQALLANCTTVWFGTNDHQTAEYVSARLGEETIIVESGGTSDGGSSQYDRRTGDGSNSTSWNRSRNWNQIARRLLKPEEVTALDPRVAVTFAAGVPPLCTTLTRYYEAQPGKGRFRALRVRAEVWLAALGLLGLSATAGVWMTANLTPLWR